jgi:hypothetical protein
VDVEADAREGRYHRLHRGDRGTVCAEEGGNAVVCARRRQAEEEVVCVTEVAVVREHRNCTDEHDGCVEYDEVGCGHGTHTDAETEDGMGHGLQWKHRWRQRMQWKHRMEQRRTASAIVLLEGLRWRRRASGAVHEVEMTDGSDRQEISVESPMDH